jgi:hypothetical protein
VSTVIEANPQAAREEKQYAPLFHLSFYKVQCFHQHFIFFPFIFYQNLLTRFSVSILKKTQKPHNG